MNKPFLPSDIKKVDPLMDWRRYVTAKAIAGVTGRKIHDIAESLYGKDADSVIKAAVAPADTITPAWAGNLAATRTGAFLRSLRPRSAAAQLLDRAPRYNLSGVASVTLPKLTTDFPAPAWIAEGGAIPVVRGTFGTTLLGPVRKLAAMSALTNELATYSAEDAEQIISELMGDAAAKALDASIFSATAASSLRPAGILNGVTGIAATAGGGTEAMIADMRSLIGAISVAGAGQDVMIFASPLQAITLQLRAGAGFDTSAVISTNALSAGTVIAVDAAAFASGFGAEPKIDIAENAAVHMDDATALELSTVGSPNTVAAPIRSAFQTDTHVLRIILQATWATRLPGAVQFITGATW
jgi:hypothetical protein